MATSLLLADDSPTIAKILNMALATEDYQIRSVLTAEDAIKELKANPPFFFLVDLTLPGKDGFELAKLIRADSKLAKIKVVLLSSAFEPVDDEQVKACGADLVIAKPFDPGELRASLRSIRDAPPKFASGSKVSGSLSGQTVTAPDGTRTSLTDTDLASARSLISKTIDAPAPEELLLGMQDDLDANSILAGLAENAPPAPTAGMFGDAPTLELGASGDDLGLELGSGTGSISAPTAENATTMLDLSGHVPSEQLPESVLDLSGAFATPPGGTAKINIAGIDFNGELVLPPGAPTKKPMEFEVPEAPPSPPRRETPPSFGGPGGPPNFAPAPSTGTRSTSIPAPPMPTKPSAPREPQALSPNAEALAAFFSAEIDSNESANAPASAPPASSSTEAEDFEKSMASIDWDQSANADLDSWSASSQAAPSAPPATPPRSAQAPSAPPKAAAPAWNPPSSDAPPARSARPGPASGVSNEPASFLFDTGGSNFRFAEDYITRITKSFVGNPTEEMPKDFSPEEAPIFRQQSNDAPRAQPVSGGGGAGNWNPMDAQKMEQIVREEVQMAVREVVEKVAWEVIPELAENIIKKELEKVMKQIES